MKPLPLQSANFKRDYVATLAIVLFFSIVSAEITLAIAIPSYLSRRNVLALQMRRDVMWQKFDNARKRCEKLKPKTGSIIEMELLLVSWNLDLLAPYLRNERKYKTMNGDEIAAVQKAIDDNIRVLTVLEGYQKLNPDGSKSKTRVPPDSVLQETKLDLVKYVKRVKYLPPR